MKAKEEKPQVKIQEQNQEPKKIEDFTPETQAIISKLQKFSKLNALIYNGMFSGQLSNEIDNATKFVKELHFEAVQELEKQEDAMNEPSLKAVVDQAKKEMSA